MFQRICVLLLLICCTYNKVRSMEDRKPDTVTATPAIVIPNHFNHADIRYSISSAHEAFLGNYGSKPIFEGQNPIGSITASGSSVFVNLRGSLGLEFLQTFQSQFTPLSLSENVTLEGNAHSGFLTAALNIGPTILNLLNQHCIENKLALCDIDLILGGYSRGSALATFLAPAFRLETDVKSVKCVTYGTLNVVDQLGANSINSIIGTDNFLGFITDQDLSKKYLPATKFYPVGHNYTLASVQSPFFNKAVQQVKYPYLQPLAGLGLGLVGITCPMWNAHVPDVYLELINGELDKQASISKGEK